MISLVVYGCQTNPQTRNDLKADQVRLKTMRSVASALSGKEVTDEDFLRLGKQMRTNEEVKDAVESLANALTTSTKIQYCPIDGKRFAPAIKYCPQHHVELKEVE